MREGRPRLAAAALALCVACGGKSDDPPAPSPVKGKLVVAGVEQQVTSCEAGRTPTQHAFVAVTTQSGTLRFENQALSWAGKRLTCEKFERIWWAGGDKPATYYWLGSLTFRCGDIVGDLELECGKVTPEGRVQLDRQRDTARRQQAPAVP